MGERSRSRGWCGWFLVLAIAALIALAVVITIKKKTEHGHSGEAAPVPGPPGAVAKKYSDALKIAMQFFDVQKSGKLVNNNIQWRGDSAVKDGSEADLDLSKGMYDAGDHMKFGFPMAFTATVLSWAILEYGDQMSKVNQLQPAQDSLKWITDYLINAHPSDNVLYIQVGDPNEDHKCWDRPETMTEKRPLTQVNTSSPGTEVAAETAAAMASASLVFKSIDSTYSSSLLKHAKQLFTFADKYRGSYSESIPEVQTYYNSTGYGDELLWAASWLYHATGDQSYHDYVTGKNGKAFAKWGSPTWFSWDNKLAGTQVLLSRVSFFGAKDASNSESIQNYRKTAEAVMCGLLPKSPTATSSRTDNGLIWVSEWNALQHPVASAFLAVLYSDYMLSSRTATLSCDGDSYGPSDLRKFAISQADYVLGNNPMKMSYLVGYGDNFPQYVHHRGASIPASAKTGCSDGFKWLDSTESNKRVDPDSTEKDEGIQYQRRLEASSNVPGPSLRSMMLRSSTSIDRKLSLSHSEPNIATTFSGRSRRKVIAEQRTASSSPEHPSFRARGRSMLSGDRKSFGDYSDDIATSSFRSEGASTSETRRIRRRSISITPEIGDDIVRAVRAMNETLKQNRLLTDQGDGRSFLYSSDDRNSGPDLQKNVSDFHLDARHDISGGRSSLDALPREQMSSQKTLSLPSSPHEFRGQTSDRGGTSDYTVNDETVSTWNKILESPMFENKPLLPFPEWNIDFTELTVGTRVGIGFFGEVFRGIWNGTDVAIKVFLEQDLTAENMEDFCNEISILSRLRHPNVILFLGACTKPPRLSMVTEYMEMGSLYYLIHVSGQKKKLSWRRRLKMLRDICRGLMCIHRMKIVHRDLKSANCLVNKHSTVKICDFGLSRIMRSTSMKDSSSAGTPEWMAPELIRNEPFTEKCDIFSLGVIMWELCTLNRPWDGVPPERVVYAVANEGSRLEIPAGPLGRLIADCWAETHERPSCEEILTRLLDCEYSLY